ncbi:hypothetical protein M513_00884, partial [Trichuris suis]
MRLDHQKPNAVESEPGEKSREERTGWMFSSTSRAGCDVHKLQLPIAQRGGTAPMCPFGSTALFEEHCYSSMRTPW